jgi:hypothetical protein
MHTHYYDSVIPPCDGSNPQSGSCEDSCAGQARTFTGGDCVIQRTRRHIGKLGAYDRVIRGSINDENCGSSVCFHPNQDQAENATVLEGDFSLIRGLRKGRNPEYH